MGLDLFQLTQHASPPFFQRDALVPLVLQHHAVATDRAAAPHVEEAVGLVVLLAHGAKGFFWPRTVCACRSSKCTGKNSGLNTNVASMGSGASSGGCVSDLGIRHRYEMMVAGRLLLRMLFGSDVAQVLLTDRARHHGLVFLVAHITLLSHEPEKK
jgi:hypothetical protein